MDVRNKVALITGSAQGLGKAFAEAFLQLGGHVFLVDINDVKGNETRNEFTTKYGTEAVEFVKCDVTKKEDVEDILQQTVNRFAKVDVVINNAGVLREDYSTFDVCIDTNLVAMIRLTMLAVEHMKKSGGGVIVNVASAAGIAPCMETPVYVATKGGMVGYTRALALRPELSNHNIRLSVLCPWFAATQMVSDNCKPEGHIGKLMEYSGIMSPADVADAMMDLIRDEGAHGTVLEVSKTFGARQRNDVYKDVVS